MLVIGHWSGKKQKGLWAGLEAYSTRLSGNESVGPGGINVFGRRGYQSAANQFNTAS